MDNFDPSKFNILMVDDTPFNLQVLGQLLKNTGYQIEYATSGANALKWLELKEFDIVLLDIMMPEMDGYEVCQKIRNQERLKELPVIFLTAKDDKTSLVKAFETGGQDYITKPFDTNELLARVRTHIELKHSKEQLNSINKTLEAKVEERTKELQIANEQLLSLDKTKMNFLNIISHEIRTPLNGIMCFTELLKSNIESEHLLQYIQLLKESALRLEEFSKNAMHITNLQSTNYPLKLKKTNLSSVINNICTKYISFIDEKNIKIKKDLKTKDFQSDEELVTICLSKIIHNAIKYSPNNSEIKIRASYNDNNHIVTINDMGPGFSSNILNNLFSMFAPGQEFVDQNTGLGLTLAQLIAKAHNGEVKATNNEQGAIVEVKFENMI